MVAHCCNFEGTQNRLFKNWRHDSQEARSMEACNILNFYESFFRSRNSELTGTTLLPANESRGRSTHSQTQQAVFFKNIEIAIASSTTAQSHHLAFCLMQQHLEKATSRRHFASASRLPYLPYEMNSRNYLIVQYLSAC